MRWPGSTSANTPIGLDLGGRTIKAAQLTRIRGGGWRLRAAAILPQPEPNHPLDQNTARHIREVFFRQGFVGNDIILAPSTSQLEIDVLDLPPRSSGAPVEQIARMEMARSSKLDSGPFELECWDLPAPARAAASTSVMAVALRHKDADALIEPFESHDLHVAAIDARCWALARACRAHESKDGITAVIDIGWNSATLALLRDGVVVYQRVFADCALSVLLRTIGAEFGLAEDETDYVLRHVGVESGASETSEIAHARQIVQLISRHIESMVEGIQAAVQYSVHRYADTPIRNLLVVGGGSQIAGVCNLMASRLGITTKTLGPAEIVECPAHLAGRAADGMLTLAIGLAMHGDK